MKTSVIAMLAIAAFAFSDPSYAQIPVQPPRTVRVPGDSLRDSLLHQRMLPKSITAHLLASTVYDSNIERDSLNTGSYGLVTGVGARYQDREIRPAVQLSYEIARHAYTKGSEWDRTSQDANVVLARRLSKKFFLETIGEMSLKGSSEDRDISNQYIFLPRLNYRLTPTRRLRLYGAYRLRRYDQDTSRNAANRYAGLEFRRTFSPRSMWESGYRYETNSAQAQRRSYTRRTYFTAWTIPSGSRDQLIAELEYRSQRYDKRPITVGTLRMPRYDHRYQPSLEWLHSLGRDMVLDVAYEFELHTSNDPRKGYRDHLLTVTTRYAF